jgi:hypothetical protein
MNWINVKSNLDIPTEILQERTNILLEDVNGFVGVGYWNSYDWVLDTYHDIEVEICFDKIERYALLTSK